ncbi:MAG: hypothetical protein NTV36_02790, partial [Candidatus Staskawiczbacteria bacterium]|nr:hypothetical protein [Candidatus Staskawiczbacteria bacterium]
SSFCVPAGEDLGQVSSSNVLQCCAGLIAYNPDPVKNYAWRGICQNPSNLSSTITITSPNEGDQWKQGSTHNITWSTTGLSSTDKVYITVTAPCMGGSSCPLYNVTPVNGDVSALSGSYSWTIPSSIGVYNSYIISVTLRTNNSIQGGKVFSVVVP